MFAYVALSHSAVFGAEMDMPDPVCLASFQTISPYASELSPTVNDMT
jgi:hypothetical protein